MKKKAEIKSTWRWKKCIIRLNRQNCLSSRQKIPYHISDQNGRWLCFNAQAQLWGITHSLFWGEYQCRWCVFSNCCLKKGIGKVIIMLLRLSLDRIGLWYRCGPGCVYVFAVHVINDWMQEKALPGELDCFLPFVSDGLVWEVRWKRPFIILDDTAALDSFIQASVTIFRGRWQGVLCSCFGNGHEHFADPTAQFYAAIRSLSVTANWGGGTK